MNGTALNQNDEFMKRIRINMRVLAVVLCYCIISGPGVLRGETPGLYHEYSREKILGFTRYLITKGEYYRASMELERLAVFYPSYLSSERYFVARRYLLMKGRQYRQAASDTEANVGGTGNCAGIIFRSDALLYSSNYPDSEKLLDAAVMRCGGSFGSYLWKRRYIASLLGNRPGEAAALLEQGILPPDIIGKKQFYRDMISYSENRFAETVTPWKALWAGAVPGLGYACAGNRPTGIVAFVLVSVLSALTFASFKTDNEPLGICFGAATAFFYSGSIVGGYLEAKRNNRIVLENLRTSLCEDAGYAEDWETLNNDHGLPADVK